MHESTVVFGWNIQVQIPRLALVDNVMDKNLSRVGLLQNNLSEGPLGPKDKLFVIIHD